MHEKMTGKASRSFARQSTQKRSSKRMIPHKRRIFSFASWNVRTLVESAGGDRRICRSRPQSSTPTTGDSTDPFLVDRKLDLLVKELVRNGVSVAGIQETKWFGCDIWKTASHTFLHSGRTVPSGDEPAIRREGVGIVLDKEATEAWRQAGETWEAVSPRLISARLKVTRAGQRRPGGSRETSNVYVSVVSAYAPTARAPPGVKEKFIEDLQYTVDKIPSSDVLLILGDFNARVGSSARGDDLWRGVRGRYGVGNCNEAGEDFLQFCTINNFTIMNTWFCKKPIHLATWKHPATRQMHMIDYVVMRAEQRAFCLDVQVMRGATC